MITREFLDEHMPPSNRLFMLAADVAGMTSADDILPKGLRWLASFCENDRFSGFGDGAPAWRLQHPLDWWYTVQIDGLSYKDSMQYLTAEGWPSGKPCWYVRIECGMIHYIGAEDPELAVLRAIAFTKVLAERRSTAPDCRRAIDDMIIGLALAGPPRTPSPDLSFSQDPPSPR